MNTDSKEAVKDLLQAHGIPVPKFEHVSCADERRFVLNDLVESYIMCIGIGSGIMTRRCGLRGQSCWRLMSSGH